MKRYFKIMVTLLMLSFVLTVQVSAELLFEKSEFAARRSKLMEKIPDGVAIIMGALDIIGYNEFFQNNDFMYELQFVQHLKTRFPQVEFKDCSQMIWDLRIFKSPAEIKLMRKAGRIWVKALTEMMKSTRAGMYEYEVEALYEYMCTKDGCENLTPGLPRSIEEIEALMKTRGIIQILKDKDIYR